MRALALLVAAILLYGGSIVAGKESWAQRETWPVAAQSVVAPELAKGAGMLLGREMAADLYWVRALVYYGSARAETGDYDQLEELIDSILDLDPHFKTVYEWAAYAVTFKEDIVTEAEYRVSVRYLERAMKAYPDEAKYFWMAGVRYYADIWPEDADERQAMREKGVDLISQSMTKKGATPEMATLAAGLHTKMGKRDRATAELSQLLMTTENPVARLKIEAKLRSIASDEALFEAVEARRNLDDAHRKALPLTPPWMYLLLGDPPSTGFDLDSLGRDDLFVLTDSGILAEDPL